MNVFIEILTQITLPIIALVALGWAVQPRLAFDVGSLNRLQIYVLLPIFLIHFLSTAEIPLAEVWPTVWFTVVQFFVLTGVGWIVAILLRLPRSIRPLIALTVSFPNSGNFGIPLAQLAFPDDYILHQAVIVSLHSVLMVTAGLWILVGSGLKPREQAGTLFRTPMIPAVMIGLLLKGFEIELPQALSVPMVLNNITYGFKALFTLGAQLANTKFTLEKLPLGISVLFSMILAPALTWILTIVLKFQGELSDLLVVAAAAPVGVLLAIFCNEYKVHGQTASTIVFISTVLSPLFVTGWVLLLRLY